MRIHRLEVTAFGPFAGTVHVDLDALAAGGLFLLHGPTGAGKTSVLDAVCFALYGTVPGGRPAGRLRSDHAGPGVAPQVLCEFTAAGRRFEVTRSPAWERPKRRGTGTTLEQARVLVRELRGGTWVAVTNRIDEAAALLEDVLGLGAEQFTKLVLLPQGDFAAFLRADAETRRQLLERLFGTDRFAMVQQWLRESQGALRTEVDAAGDRVSHLLARLDQAAGTVGVSADAEPGDLPGDEAAGPAQRAARLRSGVADALERARAARVAAAERARHAHDEHRAAVATAELQARSGELLARRARLQAAEAEHLERAAVVAAAARAAGVAPWLGPLAAARERSALALRAVDTALVELTDAAHDGPLDPRRAPDPDVLFELGEPIDDGAVPDDAALLERRRSALALVGELAAVERQAAELTAAGAALAAARGVAAGLHQEVATAAAALERCEQRARAVDEQLGAARDAAGVLDAAEARLDAAQAVLRAALDEQAHRRRVEQVTADSALLRGARDEARGHWLDLREQRLQGMAAELSRRLVDGGACPVCGSQEHPAPAPPAEQAVDEATEQQAERALSVAQERLAAAEVELARVTALAAAAGRAADGHDPDPAAETCRRLEAEVAAARRATGLVATLTVEAERRAASVTKAATRCERVGAALAEATTEVARLEERHGRLERLLGESAGGYGGVAQRRAAAQRVADAAEGLIEARRELHVATEHLAEVTRAAREAAVDAGFADLDAACAAVLAPDEVARLERACRAHEHETAVVTAALADPALARAAAAEPAQPAALAVAADLAQADDEAAAAVLDRCVTAAAAVEDLDRALRDHLTATAPLLERARLETELARCLDGTGGDNTLRMSLSSYVLAARLEQVAAAASERLQVMSGGRYSLVHCDEAGRGRGRSGLALRVVDGWTGQQRDTASLSGGESFYTSLALALGLADVVTAEAGGASVETLFVDEGFGSLDEDTLAEVMDVLDGLRSGGRVVGLVSHVADMRDRIPARLEVVKTRTGSTLRQQASA